MGDGDGVSGTGGSSSGIGVQGTGRPADGIGVQGIGQGTGDGVLGVASGGRGVHGAATTVSGVGVLAENTAGGAALQVSGKIAFRRSGIATVKAGSSKVTRTGIALTSASLVLAALQRDARGLWVRSAVPNIPRSSFTVHWLPRWIRSAGCSASGSSRLPRPAIPGCCAGSAGRSVPTFLTVLAGGAFGLGPSLNETGRLSIEHLDG
jgi:hypothetical protein